MWKLRHFTQSQSRLVKTPPGFTGEKIQLLCTKSTMLNIASFCLFKLPVSKISWCSSHFFKKCICSFTVAFTLDHVKDYRKVTQCLSKQIHSQWYQSDRLKRAPLLIQKKLDELLAVTKTVKREILIERGVTNRCYHKYCCHDASVSKLYVFLLYVFLFYMFFFNWSKKIGCTQFGRFILALNFLTSYIGSYLT